MVGVWGAKLKKFLSSTSPIQHTHHTHPGVMYENDPHNIIIYNSVVPNLFDVGEHLQIKKKYWEHSDGLH
jgi:hypothetical protein